MAKKGREGLAQAALRAGRPLTAVIYDRVSQNRHADEKSVEEQEEENREVCDDETWIVGRVYTESESASRFALRDRPEWAALVGELADQRYHVLVLWEVSRGDRELGAFVDLINMCRDIGILVHITNHERTYDVRNPGDWKTVIDQGVDAAHEPEKISKRVRRATRKMARKGLPFGPMLYGYRREYTVNDRGHRILVGQFADDRPLKAVSDSGEVTTYTPAEIVAEIGARYAKGEAANGIARDLNARGIPGRRGGARWSDMAIRGVATNPAYVARRIHQGKVLQGVQAQWPAILEVATFEACVARANDPARSYAKDSAIKHLGSGLYRCGHPGCQNKVRVIYPQKIPTYVCWPRTPQPRGTAYHVGRTKSHVDAYVQLSIWKRLARHDIAELLAHDKRADERFAALTSQIAEKQGRLDEARDAFAAGDLPLDSLTRIESALAPEIERARSGLQEARFGPVLEGLVLPSEDDIEAEWWRRPIEQRRDVIRVLTERIEVLPLGRARAIRRDFAPEESVRIVWRQPGASPS